MIIKDDIQTMRDSFSKRNIEFEFFNTRENLINAIITETQTYSTVGIGNSQTLKNLNISQTLIDHNKVVFDKTRVTTKEEILKFKKLALTSDCYISSCNAVSLDGIIVNIDHSGNRVAAITYGPSRVLLVIGTNKIENNESDAIKRALKVATPKNAIRASINSPCSIGDSCSKCTQEVRVCNYISVIRGQHNPGRMKIMLLDEELGY